LLLKLLSFRDSFKIMKKSKELNKILMESMLDILKMGKDKEREDTNG
jgi:hypothetical protein